MKRTHLKLNVTYMAKMPYSEVCMHMGVAGKWMRFRLVAPKTGGLPLIAQLLSPEGWEHSSPILLCEAGVHVDESGKPYTVYPISEVRARFMVYMNGTWAKVSLREGESLTTNEVHEHDEGYNATTTTYTFHGGTVTQDVWHHGRDCDGRHETTETFECSVHELREVRPVVDGAYGVALEEGRIRESDRFPNWREVGKRRHRDHTAESMGY